MVKSCCISTCRSEAYVGCGLSFFAFPKDPQLLIKWLEACDHTSTQKCLHVCSVHFKEEDFHTPYLTTKRLKPNAVPYYLLPKTMIRPPGSGIAVPSVCVSIKGERYLQIPPLLPSVVDDTSDSELDPLNTDTKPTTSGIVISLAPINNISETADHDYYKALSPEIKNEPEDDQMGEGTANNLPDPDSEYMSSSNPAPANSFKQPGIGRIKLQNEEIRKLKALSEKQKRYVELLRKRVKCLHQNVKRAKTNNERMKKVIASVKRYTNRSEIDNILKGRFKELCDGIQSEKSLQENAAEKTQHNKGYSIDVIKFAISLFYISPKAYELVRRYMDLPQTKMLKKHIEKDTFTVTNMDT